MRREIVSRIFAIVMSFMLVGCGQSAPADNQDANNVCLYLWDACTE